MNLQFARVLAAGMTCTLAAVAHYTWIAPAPALLAVGEVATVHIGHGHQFPRSEEVINAKQLNLFVVSPSGSRLGLQPAANVETVDARFTPSESGLHRIVLVQDRGVSSRTPSGLKPGGRDKNPDAMQASRTFRTAVAYAGTARADAVEGKPVGLEFELTATLARGVWNLQLLKQGKPASGARIEVFTSGAAKAVEAGKTDIDGRVSWQPVGSGRKAAMFSAMFKEPASGKSYDLTNYETSLHVTW